MHWTRAAAERRASACTLRICQPSYETRLHTERAMPCHANIRLAALPQRSHALLPTCRPARALRSRSWQVASLPASCSL